jgi:hypothetical protein
MKKFEILVYFTPVDDPFFLYETQRMQLPTSKADQRLPNKIWGLKLSRLKENEKKKEQT